MDSIFNLEETERSSLVRQIIHSFGFTYVCLWSHFSHYSNCLIFVDGSYKEENTDQASSSSQSPAMMSFLDYQKSMFLIDDYNRRVPGFAFKHNLTYMKHTGLELLERASSSAQLRFYQEARIKTAIFMGCKNGEIELGMSNEYSSKVNIELELKKLLPGDFPQEVVPIDQASSSSSSSLLRSLSMENNNNPPNFLFNMLQTSSSSGFKEAFFNQPPSMRLEDPLQQALIQIRTNQLIMIPSREQEEAEMIRAIIAAISSSSSSSSSSNLQPRATASTAFKRYQTAYLGPPIKRVQNLNRRLLSFFTNLKSQQAEADHRLVYTNRPTSSQLHHMISERKRREKLNESFQELRSLLPPGSKKDKASVLSSIKDHISFLKSQVEELNKRNKSLLAEHSRKELFNQDSDERLNVRITDTHESTSDSREVNVQVNVRGNSNLMDLVVRVLEFMNKDANVSVMSIDAGTRMSNTQAVANLIVLRLRILGSEWNRLSFQEALTRILSDLA